MGILLLIVCLISATGQDLLLIEQDIRDLSCSELLEEVDVVYVSTDWLLAVGDGGLASESGIEILQPGPVDLESYSLVHLRTPGDSESAEAVGEVLLCRDRVALVRLSDEAAFAPAYPGVHLVQPLRIYSRSAHEPFRPATLDDPIVTEIVAAVDEDSLKANIQALEDFETRLCITEQFLDACVWVRDRILSYGITADIVDFEFTLYGNTYTSYNVVAEKPGLIEPDVIVIICGHLDSITMQNPWEIAPGADDNASGSATVVEAARILSRYNFRYTLRFLCFGAEELGLIGSEIYASEAAANGDSIIAVMNLDMILFAPDSLRMLFVPYDTQSTFLAFDMYEISGTYVPELDINILYAPGVTYSDHASFWQNGFPALLGIEEGVDENPFYHMETDLLANYVEFFPFGTECARAAIATVAVYADPLPEGIEGEEQGGRFSIASTGPVPAASSLTVRLEGMIGAADITLFDLAGREAASVSLETAGSSQVVIDVSTLPAGVYALRATSGQLSDTRMVVIAR
jgi:hypothetical protein